MQARLRQIRATVVGLIGLALGFPCLAQELRLSVSGVERRALVVNDAPTAQPRPAVLVLHGGAGNAQEQRRRTGFDEVAQREGFMVVYPEGTSWGRVGQYAWNTGYLMRRQVGQSDDVAFLDALIDELIARRGADPARIYLTGGSNGAMMTLVYATRRAERLAGIAPVVGAMFSFDVQPSRPLPALFINGAVDDEVPIDGGMSRNPLVRHAQAAPFQPLEATLRFWVTVNRSATEPALQTAGTLTTRTYVALADGAVTQVVVDAQGGHGWPGTRAVRPGATPVQGFHGAQRIWEFFQAHGRR